MSNNPKGRSPTTHGDSVPKGSMLIARLQIAKLQSALTTIESFLSCELVLSDAKEVIVPTLQLKNHQSC